jgi:ferredoxin-NADP reductase
VTLVGAPTGTGGLALAEIPAKSLLIAGGVGITPIISLLRRIARDAPGADTVLLYFNRDDRSIIFEDELRTLAMKSGITMRFFTSARSERDDIDHGRLSPRLLHQAVPDAADRDTYVCAPQSMIAAAELCLREIGLAPERFHTESFTPPALERPADDGHRFTVNFRRSGNSIEIDGATTLLEAATRAGIRVPTGCVRGLCRACVTPKLSGTTQLEVDGPTLDRITVCNSLACSDMELDL